MEQSLFKSPLQVLEVKCQLWEHETKEESLIAGSTPRSRHKSLKRKPDCNWPLFERESYADKDCVDNLWQTFFYYTD